MPDSVLLIDDEVEALRQLGLVLERAGCEVARELELETGVAACDHLGPDVVLLDLDLPGPAGDGLLAPFRERQVPVIGLAMSAEGGTATAARQAGVEQVLVRPVDETHLLAAVARAAEKSRLRRLAESMAAAMTTGAGLGPLGDSPASRELVRRAGEVASTDGAPVLLLGEWGSGRRWLARTIHRLSPRARGPFLEAPGPGDGAGRVVEELFGVERVGAGGARERHPGLVERANGGSLYFNEISDLPPEAQPQLVRLLETRTFRRAGGTRDLRGDVRVLAASVKPLHELREGGTLRDDLAYRLSGTTITLPPVRSRAREDRLVLVRALAGRLSREVPGAPEGITPEAVERLLAYPWPGNVREMRDVLARAFLLARGAEAVGLDHLPGELRNRPGPGDRRHTPMTLEALERAHIERTLRHHGGNRTKAAQELGISRATLINKIKRYAIDR